jgi:type IV pilus assembly protein PilE
MNRFPRAGFSLIELLITLAIVAILAVITVPSFSGLVARSRRSDAMAALLDVQLAQERWRALNFSYAPALSALGWATADSPDGYYRLRINNADDSGFTVTARPVGVQQSDSCGVFAVDEQGPDYSAGFADEGCWRR